MKRCEWSVLLANPVGISAMGKRTSPTTKKPPIVSMIATQSNVRMEKARNLTPSHKECDPNV